jgi:hypothetical protein
MRIAKGGIIPKWVALLAITPSVSKHYEIKVTLGEISLKLRQTNWNVVKNNVIVVADELPSQSTNNLHLFNS